LTRVLLPLPGLRRCGVFDKQVDPAYIRKQPLPALLRIPRVVSSNLVPTAASADYKELYMGEFWYWELLATQNDYSLAKLIAQTLLSNLGVGC
jgi:hypothetical protein